MHAALVRSETQGQVSLPNTGETRAHRRERFHMVRELLPGAKGGAFGLGDLLSNVGRRVRKAEHSRRCRSNRTCATALGGRCLALAINARGYRQRVRGGIFVVGMPLEAL